MEAGAPAAGFPLTTLPGAVWTDRARISTRQASLTRWQRRQGVWFPPTAGLKRSRHWYSHDQASPARHGQHGFDDVFKTVNAVRYRTAASDATNGQPRAISEITLSQVISNVSPMSPPPSVLIDRPIITEVAH